MKPDFSSSSTYQLARALQWPITNLRQRPTPSGRMYFVDLRGISMLASDARKLCEAEIIRRQTEAGMPMH